jgi:hypothetical protein
LWEIIQGVGIFKGKICKKRREFSGIRISSESCETVKFGKMVGKIGFGDFLSF